MNYQPPEAGVTRRRFAVGQRVIVAGGQPVLHGYFGHVVMLFAPERRWPPSVVVAFVGRAGATADPYWLGEWALFEDDLEPAD